MFITMTVFTAILGLSTCGLFLAIAGNLAECQPALQEISEKAPNKPFQPFQEVNQGVAMGCNVGGS